MNIRRDMESSFSGIIEEIPEIQVDNFEDLKKNTSFLSHPHVDHTHGLYQYAKMISEKLRTNGRKIYMTEETRAYLKHNFQKYTDLERIIEPLPTGGVHIIQPPNGKSFQVTLIPVKHMPGAVMFLFKTKDNKTILYTGDFVIEKDEIEEIEALHKVHRFNTPIKIDAMYIDASFDDPVFAEFPKREECHDELVELARDWLAGANHRLALKSFYKCAYEDLYRHLSKNLGMKIFIHDEKHKQIYNDWFGDGDDNFVTNDPLSKIHVCKTNINAARAHTDTTGKDCCGVEELEDIEYKYLHIFIYATGGYNYRRGETAHKALTLIDIQNNSYYLCYPTHCSKSQLDYFLDYFKPKKILKFPEHPQTPKGRSPYKKIQDLKLWRDANIGNAARRLRFTDSDSD